MPLQRLHRTENASTLGGFLRWTSMTVLCGAVLLGTARRAAAQTFTVTDSGDSGTNTLRGAITLVNARSGGDTINFNLPAGTTITLASQLSITKATTITGPGASNLTVSGNYSTRILYVNAGSGNVVTLSGLTLTKGSIGAAGVNAGAGILHKSGNLYLDGVTVEHCYINSPATIALGGGVASYQPLTLRNGCNIYKNGCQGPLLGKGGGIYCKSLLTVQNSSIHGSNLNCSGTSPVSKGGGIYSYNTKIQNSSIYSNYAQIQSAIGASTALGGGIFHPTANPLSIQNSTLSNNRAYTGVGTTKTGQHAAIYTGNASAPVTIQNCSIIHNSATPGPNGGVYFKAGSTAVTLTSTIIAKNTSYNGGAVYDGKGPVLATSSYNLIGEQSGLTGISNGSNHNQVGASLSPVDPLTTSLKNKGGLTPVYSLQSGSPAIDAGVNTTDIIVGGLLTTDQRGSGFPRQSGAHVDIGSFESQAPAAKVVTDPADPGGSNSLRSILNFANDGDTITFNLPAGTKAITLSGTQLNLRAAATITGPGSSNLTIDANNASRVLYIDPSAGAVTISGLTFTRGNLTGSDCSGAGIYAHTGSLTMKDSVISACTINTTNTGRGAGLNINQGTLTLTNSTISGNKITGSGTSMFCAGGGLLMNQYPTIIQGCTFSGNSINVTGTGAVTASGGGLFIVHAFTNTYIQNSTISGNSCQATGAPGTSTGGGLYLNNSGTAKVSNCTIAYNNATPGPAGGVKIDAGVSTTFVSNIIAKNTHNSSTQYDGTGAVQAGTVNNLIGAKDGFSGASLTGNGNLTGTSAAPLDPKLGTLKIHGGLTATHLLLAGSPAIDAGPTTAPTDIVAGGTLAVDQRGTGFPRKIGTALDIGAVEIETVPPTAVIGSAPVATPGTQYTFTVVFSDNIAVDTGTLSNNNILVTGPNGFSQLAQFVSSTPSTSSASVTATYMLSGSLPPGVYTIALQASQVADTSGNFVSAGTLATFTASSSIISSGPTATPSTAGIGQTVQFSAAASLQGTTFTWDFGDGSTDNSGNATVSHAFKSSGVFNVTVTATNGALSSTGTVSVTVKATTFGGGTDTNGDGFSDAFDTAFGLDPNDPTQSPLPAGTTAGPLTGAKMSIKLNFAKQNIDGLTLSGTLPIPANFNATGAKLGISVGDFVQVFTLTKGKGKSGGNSGSVTIKATKGKVAAQSAKYSIKLGKDNLATSLSSAGLVNDNATKASVSVPASVVLTQADRAVGIAEAGTLALHYTAKKGKSGSAK